MKIIKVYHPFLYAVFSALFLYSHNIEQVTAQDVLLPFSVIIIFTILAYWLLKFVLRDAQKAGIILTFGIIIFFTYGHLYEELRYITFGDFRVGRHRFILPIIFGIYGIIGLTTMLNYKFNPVITKFLNITSSVLVILTLSNIIIFSLSKLGSDNYLYQSTLEGGKSHDSQDVNSLPDIYYIIPDGYANNSTLIDYYGFDNTPFLDYLKEKGFYVADSAHSNYAHTPISVSSSLNMTYLDFIPEQLGENSLDPSISYKMIRNNKISQFLKDKGYRFVLISSGWGPTSINKYADIKIKTSQYNEYLKMMFHTTLAVVIERKLLVMDWHRETIEHIFENLKSVHKIEGPKFILSHIGSPHPPYLFGANGEKLSPERVLIGANIWVPREGYIGQLQYITMQLKSVIEEILTNSARPAIIIIQADHGPATFGEWDNPSDDFLKERMGILNAYYFPGKSSDYLYPSITPVNSFRAIFNIYFKAGLEMLEDKVFYSSIPTPLKFVDVSNIVNNSTNTEDDN